MNKKTDGSLDLQVERLWQQMRYAYEHGGGHSGHLNNAWHTALMITKEIKRLNATINELHDMQIGLRNELKHYKEREKCKAGPICSIVETTYGQTHKEPTK